MLMTRPLNQEITVNWCSLLASVVEQPTQTHLRHTHKWLNTFNFLNNNYIMKEVTLRVTSYDRHLKFKPKKKQKKNQCYFTDD